MIAILFVSLAQPKTRPCSPPSGNPLTLSMSKGICQATTLINTIISTRKSLSQTLNFSVIQMPDQFIAGGGIFSDGLMRCAIPVVIPNPLSASPYHTACNCANGRYRINAVITQRFLVNPSLNCVHQF
jgi:hypothetical protein